MVKSRTHAGICAIMPIDTHKCDQVPVEVQGSTITAQQPDYVIAFRIKRLLRVGSRKLRRKHFRAKAKLSPPIFFTRSDSSPGYVL